MTSNVLTLKVGQEIVGYAPHSDTVDITCSHIYSEYKEAFDKRRTSDHLTCDCGGEPLEVDAHHALGGHWKMKVCLACKAVVHCPVTAESVADFESYFGAIE